MCLKIKLSYFITGPKKTSETARLHDFPGHNWEIWLHTYTTRLWPDPLSKSPPEQCHTHPNQALHQILTECPVSVTPRDFRKELCHVNQQTWAGIPKFWISSDSLERWFSVLIIQIIEPSLQGYCEGYIRLHSVKDPAQGLGHSRHSRNAVFFFLSHLSSSLFRCEL